MATEPTNMHVEFVKAKDGSTDMVITCKVRPSYANAKEDGSVKSIVMASSHGYQTISTPDGKSVTINMNVTLPKAVNATNPKGAVKRIALDANGKPLT